MSRLPKGCDQQGRHPEAADEREPLQAVDGALLAIALVLSTVTAIGLLVTLWQWVAR